METASAADPLTEVVKTADLDVNQRRKFASWNQVSICERVMVRAKSDQVHRIVRSAFPARDDVVDVHEDVESADPAPRLIPLQSDGFRACKCCARREAPAHPGVLAFTGAERPACLGAQLSQYRGTAGTAGDERSEPRTTSDEPEMGRPARDRAELLRGGRRAERFFTREAYAIWYTAYASLIVARYIASLLRGELRYAKKRSAAAGADRLFHSTLLLST